MPGWGKGNWIRSDTKTTVERSMILAVSKFRKCVYRPGTGTLGWNLPHGEEATIRYHITHIHDHPHVILDYRIRKGEDAWTPIEIPVRFQSTPTQFGGLRWWFTCPLVAHGIPCNRRAGKLYLPPRARYFGCRKCHELTYRSSQEAHQTERVFGLLGLDAESARRLASRWDKKFG